VPHASRRRRRLPLAERPKAGRPRSDDTLRQLVALSNRLGDPAHDYVILGEGNTSARADAETFWVKASGAALRTAGPAQFVRVRFGPVLEMLAAGDLTDGAIEQGLARAKVDGEGAARPSVETLFHAVCLQLEGVSFVAHTHPAAVNSVVCSRSFAEALRARLFPDQVVICGPASVVVPYVDPGVPLAREIRLHLQEFVRERGEVPRTIYLQSHGLVALGASATQVEGITHMAEKAARILVGTYALGGPHPMAPPAVARIRSRPDEHHRQRVLGHRES
jgi:rhamnose utilization protein RhaD (predicted bifunctional aldolase and dehydrogenase)